MNQPPVMCQFNTAGVDHTEQQTAQRTEGHNRKINRHSPAARHHPFIRTACYRALPTSPNRGRTTQSQSRPNFGASISRVSRRKRMGGCVCSARMKSPEERSQPPPLPASEIGNSGELRPRPAGKVPEMNSILGRAGIASLERAVDVLDSLGSSMSNLNASSGFASGLTARGNKISILAFEVANTIAKGANLLRSLSDENIKFLKEEILPLHGVRELVSMDTRELMSIAASDKREELDIFCGEVIRFGDLCKDPVWHNLGRYFQRLSMDLTPQEQRREQVEITMQQLMNSAKNTSELYHELHGLDRFEQDYQRKLKEEESLPAARRESLLILHSELKRQRKLVKSLKKKSLWSRNLEEVVEEFVDIVVFLHQKIVDAFGVTDTSLVNQEQVHKQSLGASGLALHYANIINKIDSIVSRPLSLPPNIRDTLYHGLPAGVKALLRSRLQPRDVQEEYTVGQIKAEMEKTLRWIVPMAESTIRAHQGFGWVGEWANTSIEVNNWPAPQHGIIRIQTLHHANKEKTDEYILELVVWLHHLVIQVKNRGFGFKALKPVRSRSKKDALSMTKAKQDLSTVSNDYSGTALVLSEEERELLERVSSKKIVLGRSQSQRVLTSKEKRGPRSNGLSRSCDNSPTVSTTLGLHLERTKFLDIMDGLDMLETFPTVPFLE